MDSATCELSLSLSLSETYRIATNALLFQCAAAAHQVGMCQMLLALGAISDPVNKYQETPLLLATHSTCQNVECRPKNDESAGLDTLRVLVEQGKNDPMQSNDIGWTPVFHASKSPASKSLLWLMNQDEYALDLNYTTPGGLTAAALLVQREDLSATIFQPLLQNGLPVDAPCADWLCFQRCQRFGIYSIYPCNAGISLANTKQNLQ
jgi:hypothetical protein